MLYKNGSGTIDKVLPLKQKENPFEFVTIKKGKRVWRTKGKKTKKPRRIEVRKQWKYAEYIVSNAWKARKREHYKKFGKICAACGSIKQSSVHHMSYRHVGNERDDELVTLCWPCHKALHDEYGVHLDLKEQTIKFIVDTQETGELYEIVKNF